MLGTHPVDVVLLSRDLDRSRRFYEGSLQLTVVDADDDTVSVSSGPTRIKLSKSTTGTKDEQTQASWRVDDVRAVVDWLRSQGVQPEEYDDDDITTVDGVADQGSALVAWITDPDGNVLSIEQPKS